MLEQYAGSVPAAGPLLAQAAASADDALRVAVLGELAMTGFRLGDLATVDACAAQIAEVADEARPDHLLWREFTAGVALVVRGDHEAGRERLRGVVALVPGLPDREAPLALLLLALSTGFLGDVRPAMESGERLLAEVRRQGAMGMLVPTLAIVAAGRAWLGDHAGAFADAGEAVELGTHLGYVADVAVAEETLAWQLAARGRHPEAAAALARARGLTDRAGTTAVAAHLALTAAFCALCRDDPAGVVAELEPRLELDGGVGAMGEPLGVAPLLVEAYVALGRRDDAGRWPVGWRRSRPPRRRPPTVPSACAPGAWLPPADDEAVTAYEAALAAHAEAPEVFERARTTLLLGQRLRRAGQRVLGAGAAPGGAAGVRRHGPHGVGGAGRRRPGGLRCQAPPADGAGGRVADLAGDEGRAPRRRGPDQPRGRGRAVPQPEDRRAPPRERVPQARLALALRAGAGDGGRSARLSRAGGLTGHSRRVSAQPPQGGDGPRGSRSCRAPRRRVGWRTSTGTGAGPGWCRGSAGSRAG